MNLTVKMEDLITPVPVNPVLILMCGLPRSGKSTWARRSGYPMVNPDSIRWEMFERPFRADLDDLVMGFAKLMTRVLFRQGHRIVIFDACHVKAAQRTRWRSPFQGFDVYLKHIDTPREECLRRAAAESRGDLIPVINRMAETFEVPNPLAEGIPLIVES